MKKPSNTRIIFSEMSYDDCFSNSRVAQPVETESDDSKRYLAQKEVKFYSTKDIIDKRQGFWEVQKSAIVCGSLGGFVAGPAAAFAGYVAVAFLLMAVGAAEGNRVKAERRAELRITALCRMHSGKKSGPGL